MEDDSHPLAYSSSEMEWECRKCTFLNDPQFTSCDVCGYVQSTAGMDSPPIHLSLPEDDLVEDSVRPSSPSLEYAEGVSNSRKSHENGFMNDELRVIMVGKTGSGKSATGNSLLGKSVFVSDVSNSSITKCCKRGSATRFGHELLVVDTPGLFDTGMTNDIITTEILKCVGISSPGPHAILLVICIGRFTAEEKDTVELLKRAFGPSMSQYLIVVFTRKDDLQRGQKSIQQILKDAPPSLQEIVQSCDGRFFAINNAEEDAERMDQQVQDLLCMIQKMVQRSGSSYYTSTIFNQTERVIKERERELRKVFEERNKLDLYEMKQKEFIEREKSLLEKLERLENSRSHERKSIANNLKLLQTDMDNLTMEAVPDTFDEDENCKLVSVQQRILEVKSRLEDLRHTQEDMMIYEDVEEASTPGYWYQREIDRKVRENVRDEIESGNKNILKRFWKNIKHAGIGLVTKFKEIFEIVKDKAGWR